MVTVTRPRGSGSDCLRIVLNVSQATLLSVTTERVIRNYFVFYVGESLFERRKLLKCRYCLPNLYRLGHFDQGSMFKLNDIIVICNLYCSGHFDQDSII